MNAIAIQQASDQRPSKRHPSPPSPNSHHVDVEASENECILSSSSCCQQGQGTCNYSHTHPSCCQLPSMPIPGDCYTATNIDNCGENYDGVNRRGGINRDTDVVFTKKQQRHRGKCSKATLMNTILSVVLAISSASALNSNFKVDAFGFSPTPLKHQNAWTRSMLGTSKKSTSLFMAQSTQSENSATTSSTSTNNNDAINPAATPIAPSASSSTNEYSFFDEAIIYIRAGSGGQGSSTYRKGINNQNGPPDGGNGGRGGDVILQMDESLNTLAGLARYAWRPNSFGGGGGAKRRSSGGGSGGDASAATSTRVLSFRAENGIDGQRQNRAGRSGKEVVVRVPPGTVVQEEIMPDQGGEGDDDLEPTYIDISTVTQSNPILVVAQGGEGGEGSSAQRHQRGVRQTRTPPQGGQRKRLKLTLKVVADVALVAVPNAGKSTLLSKVTRAKPKIADYPFTTVVPNLGVWVPSSDLAYSDDGDGSLDENGNSNSKSLILCDVPGLIAGASQGIGLGHAFLRHVERCHVILHLLDATSKNVLDEYAMINRELLNYGTGKLASMPQVVVVNKLDVAFKDDVDESKRGKFRSEAELEEELKKVMPHSRLMWISALEEDGVDDLMERVAMFVKKVKEASAAEERRKASAEEGDD